MPDTSNGLRWNANDRSFTIPTKAKDERGRKRSIKLEEPSVNELGEVQALLDDAEAASPQIDALEQGEDDPRKLSEYDRQIKERSETLFVTDKPFAHAIVKVIELLGPEGSETIDPGDLPGWCSSPLTLQHMVNRWRDPLAG